MSRLNRRASTGPKPLTANRIHGITSSVNGYGVRLVGLHYRRRFTDGSVRTGIAR